MGFENGGYDDDLSSAVQILTIKEIDKYLDSGLCTECTNEKKQIKRNIKNMSDLEI